MSGNAPNQFRCSKGFQKKKKEQTKTKQKGFQPKADLTQIRDHNIKKKKKIDTVPSTVLRIA